MTEVTESFQRAAQLDYKLRTTVAPKYKMVRIPLNNQPSASIQVGATTSVMLEWKLPTLVYNLARSYIAYNVNVVGTSAPSAMYTTTHEDVFDLGQSVTFGAAGGVDLVNLQYAQNYTKVARKVSTAVEDYLGNDDMSGLYKSNSAIANNMVAGGYDRINGVKWTGLDYYIEPKYTTSSSAAGGDLNRWRQYPLNAFVGTLLAVDRDFYSPVEQYLRVLAGVGDKMAFIHTSMANPSGNAASSAQITVNSVYLYLAVEQNTEIVQSIQDKYMKGELSFRIPYTTAFKTVGGPANAQTNIQIQLSNQYGKRLKRILHTVWNPQEKFNTAYDCANYDGEKIERYQTFLDSLPLQDRIISCKRPSGTEINEDDWLENKKFLERKSCIMSKEQYALNWFHCDQFFEPREKEGQLPDVNLDEGLLMNTQKQWLISAQIPAGGINNLVHYTFAEFARDIAITPAGPVFV